MRIRLTRAVSVALSVALAAVTLTAQETPRPTFRAGANLVRVDMYATDDGRAVEGLTRDDVEVLEDGVRQTLESFEHVRVSPAGSDARVEPDTVSASRQMAGDPRARVFVIFLDTYHTQIEGTATMRLPLGRFLDRVLGPDDLIAVMTPEMAASEITFARKTTVISDMMQNEWWGRRARLVDDDPKETLYEACGARMGLSPELITELKARRREKLTLDALEDLIVHLGGIREERKAVLTVTEGWVLFKENPRLAATGQTGPARPTGFRTPAPEPTERGTIATQPMQIECEADRLALSSIDHDRRLREIGEEANRGNVTFYPVYARGLVTYDAAMGAARPPSPQQDASNLRTRHDSLRALAVDTDGEAIINTNDIDGALRRIVDDLSSYYLFGYYSTNAKLDGRFRSITVRVKRPGVRVRARRGYRGRNAEEVLARVDASPGGDVVSAALGSVAGVNARSSFRIRSSVWTRAAGAAQPAGTVWIVGELDYRTRKELAWTAGAQAEVVLVAADGTQVSSQTLEVPASTGGFGVRVAEGGTLAPGEYAVRVRVRAESDTELAVTDTARVIVPAAASPFGEAVLWRRGPSTGIQHIRTADPRFQRSDRMRLEFATDVPGPVTARMLDRTGRAMLVPVQVSERADAGGDFRWIVVDANLAPLGAGEYVIEVAQGTTKQMTGFRVIP